MSSGLQIDDDWKRQAQEEKRRLAEQQRAAQEAAAAPPPSARRAASEKPAEPREIPPADWATVVAALAQQSTAYLGEMTNDYGEPVVSLEMAKHYLDALAVLETKVAGNLDATEQAALDAALYEARSRYVAVASEMIR